MAGASLVIAEPRAAGSQLALVLEPTQRVLVPQLGGGGRFTQPWQHWSLSLLIQAYVDLTRVSYDTQFNGQRVALIRPRAVRPSLELELAWH
jgi:hypothetical protein